MPISFAAPWVLGFLAVLPVLWWLLRLTPPAPRSIIFPALALLRDLATPEQTPARTPWWLLLLRVFIAGLVIVALADPLINPPQVANGTGAMLIAIDNDWASARAWSNRQQLLHELIRQAEHEKREVILLPTALPASGDPMQLLGPMAAKAAYSVAASLAPQPWPAGWNEARELLGKIDKTNIAYAAWLSGGLGGSKAEQFYKVLSSLGRLQALRIFGDPATPIYVLAPPKSDSVETAFSVTRADVTAAADIDIVARGSAGQVIGRAKAVFAAGVPHADAKLDLPLEAHNQLTRVEIDGVRTAASTVLLDEGWQRRPVGIIGDKAEEDQHSLLSGLFYVDRALKPFADIHIGSPDELIDGGMAVLVLTDATPIGDADLTRIGEWIKKGGVFVRFAGDRLADEPNPKETELLPVMLRSGGRALGGSMSWSNPQKLRPFSDNSPFHGLDIPADVTVERQILAEPDAELAAKTWAALNDGTPLVTARKLGRGLTVLFHVPARSEWSSLPLSGLFVDMLRRIVDLSNAANIDRTDFQNLVPLRMLDAFGEEQAPGPAARPLDADEVGHIEPGPQHPPGYYGSSGLRRALNLGATLPAPEALKGVTSEPYRIAGDNMELQAPLLAIAFILMLGDFLLSLMLRGLLNMHLRRRATAAVFFLALIIPVLAHAADDKAAVELTSKTYLAYVETSNNEIDRVSAQGLNGLARILKMRTSLDEIGVTGVNPETDELVFFPLLYWPLSPANPPLSPAASQRVNAYLQHGGMILFDSGASEGAFTSIAMKSRLGGVRIPPLVVIPQNHVLRRTFYLLDRFPGRNEGGELWLEPEDLATFDGVASVIAGNGGWAAAWAIGENGKPVYPCTPGGEEQREWAYRFGVNVVMYALTGNYKSDQMHAQALLEKLGK